MTWFISKPISAEDSDTPHDRGRDYWPNTATERANIDTTKYTAHIA
jgi:hypothetical protein